MSKNVSKALDEQIGEILKQFLKDFGEDGPISPLGVARNKLTSLLATIEATGYKKGYHAGWSVGQEAIQRKIDKADLKNAKQRFELKSPSLARKPITIPSIALTPTASNTTELCLCLDTPKGIDTTNCPIHGPKKGKL